MMFEKTEKEFANEGVGLYYPDNLDNALRGIASRNEVGSGDWIPLGEELDRTAYYLGYAMHWRIQGDITTDSTPFQDFEKLHLPLSYLERPLNILRFGCAGETSLFIEQSRYRNAGITVKSHTTVDLSQIPLKRIWMTKNLQTAPVLSNAVRLPFPDGSFDLMVTDQFLGSSPRKDELSLLEEISRVGKPDSRIIMKVFAGLGTAGLPDEIGLNWRKNAISRFGEADGRDYYSGLTKDHWLELGKRYARFVNTAYFNPETQFTKFGEIKQFLTEAGFRLEETVPYGTAEPVGSESVGDFIIRAVKLK